MGEKTFMSAAEAPKSSERGEGKSWHKDMPEAEKHAIWKAEALEDVNKIKDQIEAQGIQEGDEIYLNDDPADAGIFAGIEEYASGYYFNLKKEAGLQKRHPKEIQKVTLAEWKELKKFYGK